LWDSIFEDICFLWNDKENEEWFGNGKEKAGACVSVDEDDHVICKKKLKKKINTSSAKIACITVGMCACFQV
jgi:hypothetical protein